MRKHIAKSGASAGQWVDCSAQIKCRNSGIHIDNITFLAARAWVQSYVDAEHGKWTLHFSASRLTLENVESFLKQPIKEQLAWKDTVNLKQSGV